MTVAVSLVVGKNRLCARKHDKNNIFFSVQTVCIFIQYDISGNVDHVMTSFLGNIRVI